MKLNLSILKYFSLSKIFFSILIFSFFFLNASENVKATENFDTSYNVVYDVKEDETTRVTLYIGLTNKTSDFYAASYGVQTGYEDAKNIYVADGSG